MEGLGTRAGSERAQFVGFGNKLEAALEELSGTYDALLDRCQRSLEFELGLAREELPNLRITLSKRASGLS